ncbi:excisionase family DNA binding protein [Murinocardiopsis flavida]|uniref:Excisionase family DNA binding protein n=1 Tax=Murinocardiopsis flavida TaxID=645275 RepID=A0A2P8CY67_9ACTN|nr:helix-turn-helix domain-containing protein [Murinocardiopsis flavida]PSK89909.1 excisionase family DNA binding protein [Murinocardiopsis flavida]
MVRLLFLPIVQTAIQPSAEVLPLTPLHEVATTTGIPIEIISDLAAHATIPTELVAEQVHIPDHALTLLRQAQRRPERRDTAITDTDRTSGSLTTEQVAGFFNVHPVTVNRWVTEGRLRTLRTLGRSHRYPVAQLREIVTARRIAESEQSGSR